MTTLWGLDNDYAHFQMRTLRHLPKVTQVENDRAVFGTAVQLYYKKMAAHVQWQLTVDTLAGPRGGVIDSREEEDLGELESATTTQFSSQLSSVVNCSKNSRNPDIYMKCPMFQCWHWNSKIFLNHYVSQHHLSQIKHVCRLDAAHQAANSQTPKWAELQEGPRNIKQLAVNWE